MRKRMTTSVELVQTERAFQDLQPWWDAILEKRVSSSIFLTWEWLFTWWIHYQQNRKLFLILFREREKLIGIAPLFLEEEVKGGIRIKTLRFLGSDGPACSEFLDLIIAPGYDAEVYHRLGEFLKEHSSLWDRMILSPLSWGNSDLYWLYRLLNRLYSAELEETFRCPYIKLPSDWNQFLASLSRNFRQQVRALLRKFDQQTKMKYLSNAHHLFPTPVLINTLCTLNSLRMEHKGIDSTLRISSFHRFLLDVSEQLKSRGWLSCSLIQNEQQIIAIILNFRYGKKVWYYQAGFLPEYAFLHPGTLLFAQTIREAIEDGFLEYDFLRGEEEYKYRWGAINRPVTVFRLYNRKLRSRILYYFRKAKILFHGSLK
ncbi:MAG: GNAT family N-acetyltransferase [bacterium]|nr:GNAT family N-acetyltransferase [bacterium]